jgi:hypothetical protein
MFRKVIKLFIPQPIIKIINYILKRNIKIEKSFDNWNQAILSSGKYSNIKIFHKSKNSFLKVIKGKALYERDSVLFFNKNLNLSLISLMERVRKEK